MLNVIRDSWALIGKRDRMRLIVVAIAQVTMSLLDLLAIMLAGLVAAIVLSATADLPPPGIVLRLVNYLGVQNQDKVSLAVWCALAAAVLLIGKSIVSAWLTRRTLRLLVAPQVELSSRLLSSLLQSELLVAQKKSSQSVAYALNAGVTFLVAGVLGSVMTLVTVGALLAVVALGLVAIDPLVALGSAIFFTLIALTIQRTVGGFVHRLGQSNMRSAIDSQRLAQDALATYREISVLNRQSRVVRRFAEARVNSAYSQTMVQFLSQIPKYAFEVGLVVGAVLLCGALFMTRTPIAALSLLVVFLAAASRVTPSILRLQGALLSLRNSVGLVQPTIDLAREVGTRGTGNGNAGVPSARAISTTSTTLDPEPPLRLQLAQASFVYPGSTEPALKDISVVLEPGQSLALAGPSGAGKSTFADLILGLLEPLTGTVLLAGMPPRHVVNRWPGSLAYVPQAVWLVDGSIRENVALALPRDEVDDDRVWEALEAARLAEFIASKPQGLDTPVGERGVQLSGGQRQRLGIARALYTRPRLLVLDEATSALDAETEAAISETIQNLHGNVTTVVIAHRLATIREADVVLYLEDGNLIAQGSFSEVRKLAPRFDFQANLLGLN